MTSDNPLPSHQLTATGKASCCPLRAWFLPWGIGMQNVGLAFMIGGMLALGAFTAPVVFGQLPKAQAAPIMALIFGRFDNVLLISLALVLVGEWLKIRNRKLPLSPRLLWTRLGIISLLSGSLLYSTQVLNPEIQRLNQQGVHRGFLTAPSRHFETIHKQAESLYKMEMFAALLLLCLGGITQSNGLQTSRAEQCASHTQQGENKKDTNG